MVFNQFKPINAVQKSTKNVSDNDGWITVVNSSKNGKRILLSQEIVRKLELTDKVFIAKGNNMIAISKNDILGAGAEFRLKETSGRKVIYSAGLVKEIAEVFSLDFLDCVCHTLTHGSFETDDESEEKELIAVISKEPVTVDDVVEETEVNKDGE